MTSTALKNLAAIALGAMMAIGACACSSEKLAIGEGDGVISVSAENSTAKDVVSFSVPEGKDIKVSSELSAGEVSVRIVSDGEEVVFLDESLTGHQEKAGIEADGDCLVMLSMERATGTVSIELEDELDAPDSVDAGIANPWTQATSPADAAAKAGLDMFSVSEEISASGMVFSQASASYTNGLVEAVFKNEEGSVCIRKGLSPIDGGDISGDYNLYSDSWDWECSGSVVSCHGYSPDVAANIVWERDGFAYSAVNFGLNGPLGFSREEVESIVSQVL